MTLKEAKSLYKTAGKRYFGLWWICDVYSLNEWKSIQQEMTDIIAAKTEHKAANVIRWWGNWGHGGSAIGFARTVRRLWKQMKRKKHARITHWKYNI